MSSSQRVVFLGIACMLLLLGCEKKPRDVPPVLPKATLNYDTPVNADLQTWLEQTDAAIRQPRGMTAEQAASGVLDLRTGRLAMLFPDRIEYAASVAKIGILLAWMDAHPEASTALDPQQEYDLGLMVKASSNEMAAKFSRELGLLNVQSTLNRFGFYDQSHGGGLWVGRHYGGSEERYGDPVADHSHAATIRQLLRFYLLLEQGQLLSPGASAVMQRIFDAPAIRHDDIKFVKALAPRGLHLRRKWGTWQDWRHDSAVVTGPNRHYILVGLTHHPAGDEYLEQLATAVDDHLAGS